MARASVSLFVTFGAIASACWSKPQTERRASGSEPASSSAAATAGATMPRAAAPPRYRVFHVFPPKTRIWGVGSRLVACEADCAFNDALRRVPRTWLVDTEHATEDAGLFPRLGESSEGSVHYLGRFPDEMFAIVRTGHDEYTTDRSFLYHARARGNRFAPRELSAGSSLIGFDPTAFAPPELRCGEHCEPFELYQAEALAVWRQKRGADSSVPPPPDAFLFGNGGPKLVIDHGAMALWNGSSWIRSAAPWCSVGSMGAIRLSTGASLVLSRRCEKRPDGVYWVSNTGKPELIDVAGLTSAQRLGEARFRTVVEREREIWLVADTDSGTVLLAPTHPSEVTRPPF